MLHKSLFNSLGWLNNLRQSKHISAIFALSLSLTLAACGGGNNSVTDNVSAEPGPDGVAPTLTTVSIFNGGDLTAVVAAGEKVTLRIEASEALMTPSVTIAGAAAEVTGSIRSWQASYTMLETDTEGEVSFSIAFSDPSGEVGVTVTTTTDDSIVTYCVDGCDVTGGPVTQTILDFEDASLNYEFDDFGPDNVAANGRSAVKSSAQQDPDDATNTVVYSEKDAAAPAWGGSLVLAEGYLLKLTPADPIVSVRVRPSGIGKSVALKLENLDKSKTVITTSLTKTTVADEWETLQFDFSKGIEASSIDLFAEYVRVVIFYDWGVAGNGTNVGFYWDDVIHGGIEAGGSSGPQEPVSEFAVWGEFGGMSVEGDTYTFPASALDYGGFANTNASLYPFSFPNGGTITFTAALPSGGSDTQVNFLFESNPYPDNSVSFRTKNVTVTGETEQTYEVTFEAQSADQTFKSFIMYIVERDQGVIVKDVKVTAS